uniref:GNAT family N-acetyltransferase n=1 Tax=Streptomyces sp. SAT1 TaxID=1849967 RepID=UPI0007F9FCFB|nr:GNAT family N-acetyltransferase [Streptomyces sp. SAT1]ANO42694.1 hypothetical protein A8713_036205 [Streptomyces sp. SAT1]
MREPRLLDLARAAALPSWAALCGPADLFCAPRWLAVEQDKVGPWVPAAHGCLVAGEDDDLTAGLTVLAFDRAVDDDTCRLDKMVRELPDARHLPADELADALLPSLMCGGWFNSTVLTRPGADAQEAAAARRGLIDEAVATARHQGGRAVFFPFLDAGDTALRDDLRRAGFRELAAPARHVLDADHRDHEAYLAALPSRRRVRIRKELRLFSEAGAVTGHTALDGSNVERVAALAHNLERKYEQTSTLGQLTEWFEAIAKHVPASVFTAELDGRLFAMTLWLHHEDRLYGFHAGFDYDIGRGLPMYSVIGYHLPIAHACSDPAVKVLEYGTSADHAKLLRGTRAMPQLLAVKPLTPRAEAVLDAVASPAAG